MRRPRLRGGIVRSLLRALAIILTGLAVASCQWLMQGGATAASVADLTLKERCAADATACQASRHSTTAGERCPVPSQS
jgi:hypothetical protein